MIESKPDGGNPSDHASPILHIGAGTSRLSTTPKDPSWASSWANEDKLSGRHKCRMSKTNHTPAAFSHSELVSRGIISQGTGHGIPAAHLISTGTRRDLINANDMMPVSCKDRDMAANQKARQLSSSLFLEVTQAGSSDPNDLATDHDHRDAPLDIMHMPNLLIESFR